MLPDPVRLRDEFPILSRRTYLNSCSLGALSRRAEARLGDFTEQWHTLGASAWYEHWLARVEELRGRVAPFLGASPASLALLPSTSAALSVVAESVTYGARNRVICTELDFPTLPYQWMAKPEVEVVVLRSEDGVGVRPEQFAEAVDERTMFVATSHVFFTTGFVQDIRALARIAHASGAFCLVDGYQAAGQIPVDFAGSGVDFYTAGPLKWLCGGPGLAYLLVRPQIMDALSPRLSSWLAARNPFDFEVERFEPREDAGRFELGTPALPTIHTALGGQEVLDEIGIEAIVKRNRELTARLVERAGDAGLSLRIARDPAARSAIVMVRHPDPAGAVARLAAQGIIVDSRPGHVRVSPHFYNVPEEIDRCVEALAEAHPS
jgi:kynureninase